MNILVDENTRNFLRGLLVFEGELIAPRGVASMSKPWSFLVYLSLLLSVIEQAWSHSLYLGAYLYPRDDIRCFTDLPFGIINLPKSYERRALQRYRLRACDSWLIQRARNGWVKEELQEFLPVSLVEIAVERAKEKGSGKELPKLESINSIPKGRHTREELIDLISHMTKEQTDALHGELDNVVGQWHRGGSSELALYFSSYLLMYKLMRLSQTLPAAAAPCIITLEDDAVTALSLLHPQTLRDLCVSSLSVDVWQLMWYHFQYDYRDAAHKYRHAYDIDGIKADYDAVYFACHGMMWRVAGLPKQLDVIAFDDEEFKKGPWLNCTRYRCVTDHLDTKITNVKVPMTPWVGNPIMDHSTGLHHDQFLNHQFSVRAISATAYASEYHQFGAAAAAIKYWDDPLTDIRRSRLNRAEAFGEFRRNPAKVMGEKIYNSAEPGRWVLDLDNTTETKNR